MDNKFKAIAKEYIKNKVSVNIVETDDAWGEGDSHFAIVAENSKGFWINAFKKEKTAIRYCNKLGLTILN